MTSVRIGLEVHVYVDTQAKLFCTCPADFLAAREATTNVCAICTAQPGAKPMAPNEAALAAAVRLARAGDMPIVERARFLRKHYFYPDAPANYQRTSEPLARGGAIHGVRLTELHVEEDPGAYDAATGLVDDNRAGAPLIELVTEPDMTSPEEARAFLRELRFILETSGIARRAAGVKTDCNVSIDGGERVELKNVSGFRNAERAIEAEVARQLEMAARGERVERETRGFDEMTARSTRLRGKETAADYRYSLDPDVLPVDVARVASGVPPEESPTARRARLAALANANEEEMEPLLQEAGMADALEALVAAGVDAGEAHRFLLRDVRGDLEVRGRAFLASGLVVADLARLLKARAAGDLTPHQTTRLLRLALDGGDMARALNEESGTQVDDVAAHARAVVRENEKAVADYRAGKAPALNFLVGALMKRTRGRARVEEARAAVLANLEEGA